MKISFNPSNSNKNILDLIKNNKDIIFDLKGHSIFARGVEFKGTDTNTWRDIKINNVSIGSSTLDLRNGSNTTLTNTNGVVTINSTWRPVVDNLTSDSTTSSLSAKQGKVLKALIDGKSNSDHNHDGRYVRYYAVTTLDCNNLAAGLTAARIFATNAAHTNHSAYLYISDVGTPFQIQIPDSSIPYIYKRYYGSGKWSGWFKLNAGYADSAGSVAWANVTGKPSSYTPSAHTHAWNSLTHSSTTENQAILTNGKANGWKLQTLNIARWDNAANNAHSHANKSVLDGITSALVNSWNTAYNFVSNITGTDTDKVINKWEEIVNFLAGITEDNKLNTLLNSKLSIQQLSAKDILTTKTNNALFWVDTKGNASTITTGPFTDHPYALLSVTNYNQNAENYKFFYRSRLAFSSAGDIKVSSCHYEYEYQQDETWYNVLTSKNSGISGSTIKLNGTSITVYSSGTADGRYVKKSGDTMLGALNFANNTWNLVGDDSYIGDCNISGHFGIKAANTTYPGITFFNNASTFLGNLTAYSGNIKYGAYSLQFLDNGNTSVSASTWTNPFSNYNSNAVADGQAICVWGQSSYLSNLSTDTGDMSLWLKRINANVAMLNMVLDGEYYANGNQRLAHVSEIPNKDSWNYDDRYLRLTGGWMSGDINFGGDNKIHWGRNTDSASISFKNDGDGDANSYMSFVTSDNGNEYFRWSHSSGSTNTEWMALRSDGLRVRGTKVSLEGHNHDDRYYTESEVNSLLNAKLNRQNLSYGTWNPRGYHLAADYHYNGGDLSISENNGKMYVSVDGCFWQNEGQYRVLDTSDIGDIRDSVTLHQYLSATDAAWYPLVWGGNAHNNTSDSTGAVYKSYDKLSWQTSSQTLYATNIQTNNIKSLSIGGGIYWNSYVESASDGSDAASITLVRSGVAGGTTLVLSQMNDTNDTIQFKTNTAARLYHNSYPILTTQNTYVSNNKGYIYGNEITQVNNSDTVDGQHASAFSYKSWWHWYGKDGQPNWLWGGNNENDYYVYNPSNFRVAYAASAGNADTLDGYPANGSNDRPYGHIPTIESDGVMEVGRYIDFHNDNNGKHDFSTRLQSTGNYGNEVNLPSASGTLALINDVNNYYWANVKISTSSSTTTSPTVHTLTATRVCAGHNPGIDNSISCSNWFRSSGNTGWYNTTYQGGWYMSDTSWIRAHNGVGIYTSGQIYSSSSIRMSNILLEHTDEINNSANSGIHLNYRNSGNVSLCYGGGNVGIGTTTPSYKLDVNGQMRASGFHHASVNSDNYMLLAGGGYKSFGGDDSTPIFLGCLDLYRGDDGTISSSFYCLGYSVPFTYTRGGNYCKIIIPDTSRLSFYIIAAIASVNYSGGGMDTWVGEHRGAGAWWLHCQAFGWNEVRVKGFRLANGNNDSWWGGNPLYSGNSGANKITVCIFGHVKYK